MAAVAVFTYTNNTHFDEVADIEHDHEHFSDSDHDMHDATSASSVVAAHADLYVPAHLTPSSPSSCFRREPTTPPPTPRVVAPSSSSASSSSSSSSSSSAAPSSAASATAPQPSSSSSSASASLKRQATSDPSVDDPRTRYHLQKELHQSIFGKVYMGTDNTSGKQVALKVSVRRLLDSHTSMNGVTVLENPVEEVKVMEKIGRHQNVVSLVAVHEDDNLHWMAQEFIPGGELFDALSAAPHGHFSEDQARSIFAQILSGMSHIHAQGIAHLDISLENMLVDLDGTIKICDFGLARFLPSDGQKFRNNGENRPGKLSYMAPEVLAGEDFNGVTADIFSAGVVLFSLLTGHPAFECASRSDPRFEMIVRGQLYEMIKALGMTRRVSPTAADLISRMLHPVPERRITPEQIAQHPFMTGTASSSRRPAVVA